MILRLTKFKNCKDLLENFQKIQSSGTFVTIYDLRYLNGRTELDFETDTPDIQIREVEVNCDLSVHKEHQSLRWFISIFYLHGHIYPKSESSDKND